MNFRRIVSLADRVITTQSPHAIAEIQASVAHLYRLSSQHFQHVLDTFPLVPAEERAGAMDAYLACGRDDVHGSERGA